jgi:NADH-ubiquinone oxidoreductase chain 6
MVGGILILFIYITRIASNEKFKINNKAIIISITIPLTILTLNFLIINIQIKNNEITVINNNTRIISTINKFFTFPSRIIIIFIIIYLFIALVVTVKITNFKKGTMRQIN